MEVPALGSSEAKARDNLRRSQEEPDEPVAVATAFLVYITDDGRCVMDSNLSAAIIPDRAPSKHEVIGACENVINDLRLQMQTEAITMNVLGNLSRMQADPNYHAMVAQAQQQARAAAVVAGGTVPR